MTPRLSAAAAAALLGLASPALAFHPCQHSCGTSHHTTLHTVAAPTTFHLVAPAPTFHLVAPPTFHLVSPGTTIGSGNLDAAGFNALNFFRLACALVDGGGGGGRRLTAEGGCAADLAQIKEDLDAIRAKLLIPRTAAAPKGAAEPKSTSGPHSARPAVSPRLVAIDAGLDEIEALQRRTAELRAAAAAPAAPARTEVPAVTRRAAPADADLDEIEAIQRRTAALRAAAAPTVPDGTVARGR